MAKAKAAAQTAKAKSKSAAAQTAKTETDYTREALLAAKQFSDVQRDFLGVILNKPTYTLAEARAAVDEFMKKE